MKMVILDGYGANPGDLSYEHLRDFGELTVYDRTPKELTVERAAGCQVVMSNKTLLYRNVLEQLPDLRLIALLSTGANIVDLEYAKSRGILVANIPAYSTDSVAQHAFALILAHFNQVTPLSSQVRDGRWSRCKDFCFWDGTLTELAGKTIGIIGFGSIGARVADLAAAFGMKVLGYRRHPSGEESRAGFRWATLDEIYTESDIVSLHCPLTEETRGMIGWKAIEKMKPGVFVVNTGRGPLLNEAEVAEALNSGRIGGIGVDVLSKEPPQEDNPLLTAKNAIITPHVAWATLEARGRLIEILYQNIKAFVNGKPIHIVNP